MKFKINFLILFLFAFSISAFAQTGNLKKGWKKFSKCHFTFSAPATLKDLKPEQIDSCGSEFEDKVLQISITYGNYGEAFVKSEAMTEFKEERIKIDGRETQLVTYIYNFRDTQNKMQQDYVSGIYVSVLASPGGQPVITSLVMTITGRAQKDLETAKQIFKTIKFQ